jgi:phospholipase C
MTGVRPPLARDQTHASRISKSKISHVVVIIQENRSLDGFFAGYPGANAPMTGCGKPTAAPEDGVHPIEPDAARRASSASCPPGDIAIPLREVNFKNNPDLRYDWYSSLVDWDNGNMDGNTQWGKKHGRWNGSIGPTSEGYTDGRATSLDDAFDFSQSPRKFVKIKSKYPMTYFLHQPSSNDLVDAH